MDAKLSPCYHLKELLKCPIPTFMHIYITLLENMVLEIEKIGFKIAKKLVLYYLNNLITSLVLLDDYIYNFLRSSVSD